ncbi:hypothetical protein D9611_002372 [Ephemerocybe angulata]|uniref:Ubiquitin-like domain-containing protein n=1 Tax=Ephemerocybe angulata TaxID=980116 RepID=A0A8H5C168_9AGAR|nr:hypothetical protein D9611_002372 [Tulosesus angulatus]
MSNLDLRIELPAYSHSFNIHVSGTSDVRQVKEEISKTCPGQPRIDGQRLIWRGRNLANEEKVEDLWKSSTDSRILHLAVHPSAWEGQPPEVPTPETPAQDDLPSLPMSPPATSYFPPTPSRMLFPLEIPSIAPRAASYQPIPFIALKHQSAIQALMTGAAPPYEANDELRDAAKTSIERVGWIWPAVLDEAYPPSQPGGLSYEPTVIGGQRYLSLVDNNATATPVQIHALSTLSYTFSLLNLSVSSSTITRPSAPITVMSPEVNQLLQQLGLPQLRVAPNQNPNQNQNDIRPQLREIPLRPLLMPVLLLVFRTVLLLYFVAPARKPIFGVLILAWMLYEMWQPIRNGLLRVRVQRIDLNNLNPDRQQPNINNPAPPGAVNNNVAQGRAGAAPLAGNEQGPLGLGARQLDAQAGAVLDTLANLNLQEEQIIIDQSHLVPAPEPGIGHKLVTFLGLLFATLHPAVWDRRRAALRRREGPIRMEANMARDPPARGPDEEETEEDRRTAETRQQLRERQARRPLWIRRYIARALAEEWVDDLD